MNVPHEHDEDGNCIPPEGVVLYSQELPNWRFSLWDVAGITLHTAGGLLANIGAVLGTGLGLLARECAAMANNSRQTYDLREAQRLNQAARQEMSRATEAILGLPEVPEP